MTNFLTVSLSPAAKVNIRFIVKINGICESVKIFKTLPTPDTPPPPPPPLLPCVRNNDMVPNFFDSYKC